MKYIFAILIFGNLALAANSESLNLLRRWVVFPFAADSDLRSVADSAWWKTREVLTQNKKFLVASRQFLIQKDVYQPRKNLDPNDVMVLARLLDADVLVTGFNEAKKFQVNVYLAQNGMLFWSKIATFQPAVAPVEQFENLALKVFQELSSVIPYQGFTIIDPLIAKPVFEDGTKKLAIIDVGNTDGLSTQTDVQWVDVKIPSHPEKDTPILGQSKMAVIAEGRITKIRRGTVVAEIIRATNMDDIKEKVFVRIPKIAEKVTEPFLSQTNKEKKDFILPELSTTQIPAVSGDDGGQRKNTTIFGGLLSFLGILALTF